MTGLIKYEETYNKQDLLNITNFDYFMEGYP